MQAKNVLYAAVGAPVVAARKVTNVVGDLKGKINEETADYTKVANKALESWASEGEKVVARVSDNKTVEEITAKVDLDQVQEQVGKLRTQLEDMLATWRTSFRPAQPGEKTATTTKASATKASATKASASKASATKASASKASATKASASEASATKAAKKPAATKASASKASASKASATKPAAKKPAAKKPAASKASANKAS